MKLELKRRASKKPQKKSQLDGEELEFGMREELDEYGVRSILKPEDQLQLTEQEGQYKQIPQVQQMAIHFWHEGHMLPKDSDEARRQMARDGTLQLEESSIEEDNKEVVFGTKERDIQSPQKKLTNQFNFCERSTQTYNNPHRERGNMTEPPPRANFSANITQWSIYDDYIEDFERQQEKSKDKKPTSVGQNRKPRCERRLCMQKHRQMT
ncbi:unnamed protein product [Heterobilharzia americana]|nr:unnamed protein product [Heterobilharzia americana]